ncbi:MAG: ATP-binding protein [Candidatus Eisenbacteria bacterium]|nr:ATP-binding protein [Candidatus Eisenbacteria bacterium]
MDLRKTWKRLDLSTLTDWVNNGQQEGLHLDFKQLVSSPSLTKEDRKIFAKAVSGFANSEGGVVVWGIDARKDADGVDAAIALMPLKKPKVVLGTFKSLTGDAASPIVDGVDHRLILDGSGGGFVATIVPASDHGPHMAGHGESRYYKRSGDSFYKMEHFDIADMFGRRVRPVLSVLVIDRVGMYFNERAGSYEPLIAIENTGRGIARFPFLRIEVSQAYSLNREYGLGGGDAGLPERREFGARAGGVFAGGVDHVIHPGTILQVQRLKTQRNISVDSQMHEDLIIDYEVACDGVRATKGRLVRTGGDVLKFVKRDLLEKYPPK